MHKNILSFIILLAGLLLSQSVLAQEKKDPDRFYYRVFSSGGDSLYYRVLYPKGYVTGEKKKYPLLIVLHGDDAYASEGGHTNNKVYETPVVSLYRGHKSVRDQFPAIVVVPQCEEMDPWVKFSPSDSVNVRPLPDDPEQTYSGELLERLVKYYLKHYQVDKDRVYIVGQGTVGGSGALDLAVRRPKWFAAVVSMGGAVSQERVKPLKKTPVRLYSSNAITKVPITQVNDVYIGLKMYGSQVVEPVNNYGSLDEAELVKTVATLPDFLSWIFSKKK